MKIKIYFIALFSLFLCGGAAHAEITMGQFLTQQSLEQLGKTAFLKRCSGCHGVAGDAATASPFLNPKPRNLTSGIFKFRSTPIGMMPTDQDLLRTITQGVLGSSMPSFRLVPETEQLAIIQYIKTLSPSWADPSLKGSPVAIPEPPVDLFKSKEVFLKSAAAGREVFKMSCALCHGHDGKGHGPAAAALVDEWGAPIVPLDLTKPYIKSGWGAKDIYRVLATGLSGTPMAAFAEALGTDKTWEMVAYVMYIRGETAGLYATGTIPPIPTPEPVPPEEMQ